MRSGVKNSFTLVVDLVPGINSPSVIIFHQFLNKDMQVWKFFIE